MGRNLLNLGMQGALMQAARRGESWDPSLDAILDIHGVWSDSELMFAHAAAAVLKEAVAFLPEPRASGWFDAQATLAPTFTRLLLVTPRTNDELIARLLTLLASNAKLVRKPAFDWLTELVRELGPGAAAFASVVLKGKLKQAFEAGFAERGVPEVEAARPRSKATTKAKAPQRAAAIQRLEKLATALPKEAPRVVIFALEAIPESSPEVISRVGGPGFDLGDRHPTYEDLPMMHVVTLSLAELPELQARFPDARAFALYISEPRGNEAFEPDTAETAVVRLRESDLARGAAPPGPQDLPLKEVRVTRLEVPVSIFARPTADVKVLKAVATLPARAGGEPLWLQNEEALDDFVMQFDERFAPLDLGDSGVMYVFADTAFWQSK